MTNYEKYKEAFSVLHTSSDFHLEVETMNQRKKHIKFKKMIAAAAACLVLVTSATAAYAADVGGIQRTVQLWIHGDQTEATLHFDGNGNYIVKYPDSDGTTHQISGGGVAFNEDGSERPLTEEELLDEINSPTVQYEEDGSVMVYWFDQKIDITDKFKNDICYVKLVSGEETLYLTVKFQKGSATSSHRYLSPWEFN